MSGHHSGTSLLILGDGRKFDQEAHNSAGTSNLLETDFRGHSGVSSRLRHLWPTRWYGMHHLWGIHARHKCMLSHYLGNYTTQVHQPTFTERSEPSIRLRAQECNSTKSPLGPCERIGLDRTTEGLGSKIKNAISIAHEKYTLIVQSQLRAKRGESVPVEAVRERALFPRARTDVDVHTEPDTALRDGRGSSLRPCRRRGPGALGHAQAVVHDDGVG